MCHLCRAIFWCGIAVQVIGLRTAVAGEVPRSKLAFFRTAKELQFDTGAVKGSLGEAGKPVGLKPLVHSASGVQLAGAFGILSPYRLLTSDARFGTAAWEWRSETELLADGSARVRWSPDQEHPLELTAVYCWSAGDTLDLKLAVKPVGDLRRFELFLASYFNGFPQSLACVKAADLKRGGRFMEAVKSGGDWQMFPRDEAAPVICRDGRWNRPPNPVTWEIMPYLAAAAGHAT